MDNLYIYYDSVSTDSYCGFYNTYVCCYVSGQTSDGAPQSGGAAGGSTRRPRQTRWEVA